MRTDIEVLFDKIENCKKHIQICKDNLYNIDFEQGWLNCRILELTKMKENYQCEFDKLYNELNK